MFSVHLILSGRPDYMYIMCNPPDVRWRVLNDTMSLYNLRIYWIYGLKGLVHEHATASVENLQPCNIFYKLPELLECHHKLWLEAHGQRATLAITSEQRKPVTTILANPNRRSHVLPAIITAPPSGHDYMLSVPLSYKGKGLAISPPVSHNKVIGNKSVVPALELNVALTSTSHAGPSVKKQKTKVCASCQANNCPNTPTYKGSGN